MTRRRALIVAPLVCLAVLVVTAAQAAEDVLKVIPEGALGFAVVNRLAETDTTIQEVGKRMQLPTPSLLGKLKKSIGIEKGLDEKGSSAIVVMPPEDEDDDPVVLLYVPVTDYGQFIGQLEPGDDAELVKVKVMDGQFLVGRDGGYAVFAEARHGDVLKKAIASPNRLSEELAPLRKWLAENAAGIVVTRAGIELISAKVQEGLQQVRKMFEEFPEEEEIAENLQTIVAVFGIYEEIFKALEAEVKTYAAAVRVDEKGEIHLVERLRFTADGQCAKMIAEVKPPEGDLLAGLPSGPFVIALSGVLPEGMMNALTDFSVQIMKAAPKIYGLDEEQAKKLAEISRQSMKGIRGTSMYLGVGKAGAPLFSSMVVVMKVDDSHRYLADYRKTIKAMNELAKGAEDSVLSATKVKEVRIGGVEALEIKMKFPKTPAMGDVPDLEEMMKKLFGPGGRITAYIAAADEHTIVTAYTSKGLLRRCLKAVKDPKSGLAGDAGVAKTAAVFAPGAQWVGYWSPKGTVDFINRIIPAFAPPGEAGRVKFFHTLGIPAVAPAGEADFRLPDFPPTPPVGFAARTAPGELKSHTVVPAAAVKAIGGYVVEIKKMIEREMEKTFEDVGEALEEEVEEPLF